MKKLMVLILVFCFSHGYSNSKYENQIKDLATDVAELLENRGIQKVAVWNFVSMNADNEIISKYLSEDFSVYLQDNVLFDRFSVISGPEIRERSIFHCTGFSLVSPEN